MTRKNLLELLGLSAEEKGNLKSFSTLSGVSIKDLKYYSDNNILPSNGDLERISIAGQISITEIKIGMGILDPAIIEVLMHHSSDISKWVANESLQPKPISSHEKVFETKLGTLYQGDCLSLLQATPEESFDTIFADPPFNLNKQYLSNFDDNQSSSDYMAWCLLWLEECTRCLKKGGSLFIWNLPKWNSRISAFLGDRLTFKHWIASDIKQSLPIQGKLYPSHYSLLYFTKGERANVFHPDRLPMDVCRHCLQETKDYGGYKDKMNPSGINLTDVWLDIPPVRHSKYKKRAEANELSIKLLDRVIEMSTNPGDIVFDPFGGSGTTYAVAEIKDRKWIGIELGPTDQIIERLKDIKSESKFISDIRQNYNSLFTPKVKQSRKELGIWTDDSFEKK